MRQALVALALREVIALDVARVHLCTSGVKRCKDSFSMPRYGVYSSILTPTLSFLHGYFIKGDYGSYDHLSSTEEC